MNEKEIKNEIEKYVKDVRKYNILECTYGIFDQAVEYEKEVKEIEKRPKKINLRHLFKKRIVKNDLQMGESGKSLSFVK